MKRQVGLWIDHRQAVIVTVANEGEEIKRITSNVEKHVRFASGSSEDGSAEDTSLLFVTQTLSKYLVLVRPRASSKNVLRAKNSRGVSLLLKPLTR